MPTAFRDVRFQGQSGKHLLTLSFSGFRPRLCENSDVELARRKFVSIRLNKKRTALTVTVGGRRERKQFCAFSAHARFHTAWTLNGHRAGIVPAQIQRAASSAILDFFRLL